MTQGTKALVTSASQPLSGFPLGNYRAFYKFALTTICNFRCSPGEWDHTADIHRQHVKQQ